MGRSNNIWSICKDHYRRSLLDHRTQVPSTHQWFCVMKNLGPEPSNEDLERHYCGQWLAGDRPPEMVRHIIWNFNQHSRGTAHGALTAAHRIQYSVVNRHMTYKNSTTVLGTESSSGDFGCGPDGNTPRAVRIRLERRIFPQVRASPYQIDIECCAYCHPSSPLQAIKGWGANNCYPHEISWLENPITPWNWSPC